MVARGGPCDRPSCGSRNRSLGISLLESARADRLSNIPCYVSQGIGGCQITPSSKRLAWRAAFMRSGADCSHAQRLRLLGEDSSYSKDPVRTRAGRGLLLDDEVGPFAVKMQPGRSLTASGGRCRNGNGNRGRRPSARTRRRRRGHLDQRQSEFSPKFNHTVGSQFPSLVQRVGRIGPNDYDDSERVVRIAKTALISDTRLQHSNAAALKLGLAIYPNDSVAVPDM